MTTNPLCERFSFTDEEAERRRAYLRLDERDKEQLKHVRSVIRDNVERIIDDFYAHLEEYEELEKFIGNDRIRARLRRSQRDYLLTLGKNVEGLSYFEDRLRIGVAHERVGLDLKWYLAANATLFESIAADLAKDAAGTAGTGDLLCARLTALAKIQWLDAVLAVETYYRTSVQRLEELVSQLTEAEKKLRELSRTDPLTRVNNRRYLTEVLELETVRSLRFGHPLSILFVDIDHFKRVNDERGHAAGDRVLKQVAALLNHAMRQSDVVGRYGGEEFVIGLIECDQAIAERIAERIRLTVARSPIDFDGDAITVTVSIGLATMSAGSKGLGPLIERADAALYQAKRAGRDRVCVAEG